MRSTLNEPKSCCRGVFCFYRQIACIFFLFSSLIHSLLSHIYATLWFFDFFYFEFAFIEKSRTMEALYNGNWIAVGRFSDTVNVAIHRSTSKAAWNVSTGEAITGNWWHSDKSRAGALRKWKPIDLVRYVSGTIAVTDQVFFILSCSARHGWNRTRKNTHTNRPES